MVGSKRMPSLAGVCPATAPAGTAAELNTFIYVCMYLFVCLFVYFLKSKSVLHDLQKDAFRTFVSFPRGYLKSQQLRKHRVQLSDIGD